MSASAPDYRRNSALIGGLSAGQADVSVAKSAPLHVELRTLVAADIAAERVLGAVRHAITQTLGGVSALHRGSTQSVDVPHHVDRINVGLLPLNRQMMGDIARARALGAEVVLVASDRDADLARALIEARDIADKWVVAAPDGSPCGSGTGADDAAVWLRPAPEPAPAGAAHDAIGRLKTLARLLRVHQWVKNVFLLVPLFLAFGHVTIGQTVAAAVGFIAFSLVASATYILNDLFDIENDRGHDTKRHRPMASGVVSVRHGLWIAGISFSFGAALCLALPIAFAAMLALYTAVTVSYSAVLKRMLLVDVIVLAGLHTLRILAGGALIGQPVSFWLLAFSMLFFTAFALVKRYVELLKAGDGTALARVGRAYRSEDREVLLSAGMAASFAAVTVMALYINAPEVTGNMTHPWMLWPICPLILYLLLRTWVLARRGDMPDDPVWFAVTDWRSQLALGLTGLVFLVASHV